MWEICERKTFCHFVDQNTDKRSTSDSFGTMSPNVKDETKLVRHSRV